MKNKFIVFEGIDASGKSVVGKLVANALFSDYIESPTEEFQLARAYLEKSSLPISRFLFYIATNIDLSQKIKRKSYSLFTILL